MQPQPPNMALGGMDVEERKEFQKKQEKLKRFEKKKEQDIKDAATTVMWLCAVECAHALLMLIPLIGSSWTWAQFVGTGTDMITVRVGLFVIEVDVGCGQKNALEDRMCKAMRTIEGNHMISKARAMAHTVSHKPAMVLTEIFYTNMVLFTFFVFAVIMHLATASLLYYYWFHCPLPKIREYAQTFFFLSPLTGALGMALWIMITPNLKDLPTSFSNAAQAVTAGLPFVGWEAVDNGWPYGWCFNWAFILTIVSGFTLMIWPCFFAPHQSEEALALKEEEEKELASAQGILQEYGAVGQDGHMQDMQYAGPVSQYAQGHQQPQGQYPQGYQQHPEAYAQQQQQGYAGSWQQPSFGSDQAGYGQPSFQQGYQPGYQRGYQQGI